MLVPWNSAMLGVFTPWKLANTTNQGFFPPKSQLLNTYHQPLSLCFSYFPNCPYAPLSPIPVRGWGCQENDTRVIISKAETFSLLRRQSFSSIFPLSSDHSSVYYCIWGQPPTGTWLFITSESSFHTVICQAFIYSRQLLIEIWKMAWILNDKQMRRSDENHTCLKTICFHVKYIWDF